MEAAQTVEPTKTIVPVPTQEEGFGDGFAEEGDSEKASQGASGAQEGDFEEGDAGDADLSAGSRDADVRGEPVQGGAEEAQEVIPTSAPEETLDYWKDKALRDEKRARDNQAEYTKGQQKIRELEDKLKQVAPESDQEPEWPEEVQEYLTDFPEAKTAMRAMAEHTARKIAAEQVRPIEQQFHVMHWERAVTSGTYDQDGKFVPGVPEYYELAAPGNKNYWAWYEKRGYGPCDPVTAISRLNEYKREHVEKVAGEQAGEKDKENRDRAARTKEVLSGGLPASQRRVAPSRPKDDGSFSDGFNDE